MKSKCPLLLCVVLLGAIGGSAHADILLSDDFGYDDGPLAGMGGAGDGWSGAWRVGCCGPAHDVAGGEVVSNTDFSRVHRNFDTPLGADGTSVFVGLDYSFGVFYDGFEMHNGSDDDSARSLELGLETAPEGQVLVVGGSTIDFDDQTGVHRYVIGLNFGVGGSDSVELFIDGSSVGSTALATEFTADRLGFASFVAAAETSADNLIIATTFAEAYGVPEPGAVALLALAGAVVAVKRR